MGRFRDRPVGEILLLMITGTICTSILATGGAVVIIEIVNPETDTAGAATTIGDALAALIALLAGFLAGRTDVTQRRDPPP